MPRSSIHSPNWTFLLLLASSLLLRQVAGSSDPSSSLLEDYDDAAESKSYDESMGTLLDKTSSSFRVIISVSSEIYRQFHEQHKDKNFIDEPFEDCHTSALAIPSSEQAEIIEVEYLLKLILNILRVWKDPLHNLGSEMGDAQAATEIKDVETKITELEKEYTEELNKVGLTTEENEEDATWKDKESLKSDDETTRLKAVHSLLRCLHWDSYKVAVYAKILNCRIFQKNC